jgi:hypothetical protein
VNTIIFVFLMCTMKVLNANLYTDILYIDIFREHKFEH